MTQFIDRVPWECYQCDHMNTLLVSVTMNPGTQTQKPFQHVRIVEYSPCAKCGEELSDEEAQIIANEALDPTLPGYAELEDDEAVDDPDEWWWPCDV